MKIVSNNVGNYGPGFVKTVKPNQAKPKAQTVEPTEVKTVISETKRSENLRQENKTEGISSDEKKFFMSLYPENSNEIVDYHYYQKSGKMSGVSVGSLLDRRG